MARIVVYCIHGCRDKWADKVCKNCLKNKAYEEKQKLDSEQNIMGLNTKHKTGVQMI